MPTEAQEIAKDGKVSSKRRFDQRDWEYIAEYVIGEWEKRKRARDHREKCWKDIDRQIEMEPDRRHKMLPNGQPDLKRAWMAEMELPLQAQALEILTADSRRMKFPDVGPWFRAHAEVTDDYLSKVDFQSIIKGDENEVPSRINQDNADKLVEGFLMHQFRQYDFQTRMDQIDAEAFKYGMGVGRARMETKNVYIHEAMGVRNEKQKLPVLVPVSIKGLYLDDPKPSMHSSQVLGPAHIAEDWIRYENILLACNKGSTDPDNEDGGWMPNNARKLEPNDDGYVQILEMEGDIVLPRKRTRSMVLPGAIVTVAVGGKAKGGDVTRAVIRFRWRKVPYSSYLLFPYHYEGTDEPYPTSPLMKGRPIQIMATDALNRLMDSAALKVQPPVGYDRQDTAFAVAGGPEIYPGAQWGTIEPTKVHAEIGGDPSAMSSIFLQAVNLYAELTGILPSRVGAQTKSHTTAFAKDSELQRGAVRTVDYVRSTGAGPITRWLDIAYHMGRDSLGKQDISFYIDAYGGYVEVNKDMLPERANFEWFGAGGPAEQVQKVQSRLQSLQLGLKIDQIAVSQGREATIDVPDAIRSILREGGWTDLDAIAPAKPVQVAPVQAGAGPAAAALSGLVPSSGSVVQG